MKAVLCLFIVLIAGTVAQADTQVQIGRLRVHVYDTPRSPYYRPYSRPYYEPYYRPYYGPYYGPYYRPRHPHYRPHHPHYRRY